MLFLSLCFYPLLLLAHTGSPLRGAIPLPEEMFLEGMGEFSASAHSNFHPLCCHTLALVGEEGCLIELEDGSQWSFNWFWKMTTRHWQQGDLIIVTYFDENILFPYYKFENISQKKVVWGSLFRASQRQSPACHWIEELSPSGEILLNTGHVLYPPKFSWLDELNWKERDLVFILGSSSHASSCDLLNMTRFSFFRDAAFSRTAPERYLLP